MFMPLIFSYVCIYTEQNGHQNRFAYKSNFEKKLKIWNNSTYEFWYWLENTVHAVPLQMDHGVNCKSNYRYSKWDKIKKTLKNK